MKDNQHRGVQIVAAVFMVAALVGAIHSLVKGYSDIYTGIFVLLAGGFLLIALIVGPIDLSKIKNEEANL